jgi:hypothetical protein
VGEAGWRRAEQRSSGVRQLHLLYSVCKHHSTRGVPLAGVPSWMMVWVSTTAI